MNNSKLNVFVSYSHSDNDDLKTFLNHLAPMESNELISIWVDKKVNPGENFQIKINQSLDDADIVCLLISSNFLSSDACLEEKTKAIKLLNKRNIHVVPIILSACGWKDDSEISKLLALPNDGVPVSSFSNPDSAWHDVYEGLKLVIDNELKMRQIMIREKFKKFLQNTDLLANAHANQVEVCLDQIYVYPDFSIFDNLGEVEAKINSKKILDEFFEHSKLLIVGDGQSGKTSFCKNLFIWLQNRNFVPIYLSDNNKQSSRKVENRLSKAFAQQYEANIKFENLEKNRVVPIIDDFHYARNKEKLIKGLADYPYQIVVVDDVFGLNIKDKNTVRSFQRFRIQEFKPSQRHELIMKWVNSADNDYEILPNENSIYQNIDKKMEWVDSALGKSIGRGIMPSYPFFILMAINTYETFSTPLDQEITSQGYCYQALIYIYLRKQNVKNDEIDTYINFLTESAIYIYRQQKLELSETEFERFIESYSHKFNLPVKINELLSILHKANILLQNSTNNFSFSYLYLYYFFVAKYLADNLENNRDTISNILNNLDKQDNAYIAVFLSHHSKNVSILNDTIDVASKLFNDFEPITLTREEFDFFDDRLHEILDAVLPHIDNTPAKAREQTLNQQDKLEEIQEYEEEVEDSDYELSRELRRSVKTVEVMGTIIKNRAGSLEKALLERVFEEGVKVHFRVVRSFIELLRDVKSQQVIVDYISSRLKSTSHEPGGELSKEELQRMSEIIFWNLNFAVVYGVINKIIHSLGSDKLTEIIKTYCEKENSPATFLVEHGILMWYRKNIQIDNIKNRVAKIDFSKTANKIIDHLIVNHCRFHQITYQDRQRIVNKLRISSKFLYKK